MGGVRARECGAATSSMVWRLPPCLFRARKLRVQRPAFSRTPAIIPVSAFTVSPGGRPRAVAEMGNSPPHGIRKRNGRPGVAPNTRGALISGAWGWRQAISGVSTGGGATIRGGSEAFGSRNNRAPAQSAWSRWMPSSVGSTISVRRLADSSFTSARRGVSPPRRTGLLQRSESSAHSSKMADPFGPASSSMPTMATNRLVPPWSSMWHSLKAWVPKP